MTTNDRPDQPPTRRSAVAPRPDRRQVLRRLAGLGVGSAVFQRALAAGAEQAGTVTPEMIRQAEWVAGLSLTEGQRQAILGDVRKALRDFTAMRAVHVDHGVPPAVSFHPRPFLQGGEGQGRGAVELSRPGAPRRPASAEDLAFLPVTALAELVRTGQVTSVELTKLYLERLRKHDPVLHCVVTLTDELALKQAERADREIAAGRYRGPLHGVPWGAKDLIAVAGYKTTWGAAPFKDRTLDETATVARRLEDAGAVLVAKLSLGALAWGDQWFGGMTRNPWDPRQGSSGSSAGSASAVAAGLVGFAIGSETYGSIVSPCSRCGATGLRPTFGRVSRAGCMTLSWSMDKLGPIARSVEDCALVFGAIHGADGLDPSVVDRPFHWPPRRDLRTLRVGYVQGRAGAKDRPELKVLRELGVQLVPIKLPDKYPVQALNLILDVEAATVFDDLLRRGVTGGVNNWPIVWRTAQLVPGVEYLRANRIRTLLMRAMDEVMEKVDLYVGGGDLLVTNLTGHPTVVLPNGFRPLTLPSPPGEEGRVRGETPTAITFTGRLFGEVELLAVAQAYQEATGFHLRRPPAGHPGA
jgi:Asp-tRNA(Asn)/Glu-tRNA(Gln) amidotransferase A subunit family amidase